MDKIDDLSQFKFDSEGDTSITENASLFLKFCEHYEIECEYVACILFCLTLEGKFNRWCHTLPPASIYSFEHLIKELHLIFDRYDYKDVLKIINQLIMKPNESTEDFANQFLHLCYEFPKEEIDWDFFKQKFECLVHLSFYGESKPP